MQISSAGPVSVAWPSSSVDLQVAAGQVHGHRALAPAVGDAGRAGRDRARARRERLPRPALPDADGDVVLAVHPDELDVRAFREALVVLDQRAEPQQLGAVGMPPDDGVRVADRDRRQLDLLAVDVDRLGLADLDGTHLLLDLALAAHRRAAPREGRPRSAPCRRPPRRASQRAAIRVPLPDSSATEPSGFQITTSAVSPSAETTSRIPSEPTPKW